MQPETKNPNSPVSQQPSSSSQAKSAEPLVEPGEKLISVVRRHPIGLVAVYLGAAIALAAVATLYIFVSSDKAVKGFSSSASGAIGLALFVVLLLAIVLAAMVRVYKQSELIVTDKSLIQIIQRSLFSRKVSRLSMSNVEDVNAEKRGIWATIFNYGTLTIETAGEVDNFIFPWCPNPDKHADSILQARQQYVQKYGEANKPAA